MTGHGFDVSVEQLRSHSETVDRIAESMDEVAEAAATERAGGLVYGVLFDVYALPILNAWADSIHGYVEKNAEVGHSIAKALAANADTYEGVDEANKKEVSKSGGGSW